MQGPSSWKLILMFVVSASGLDYDDKSTGELCYVCSCSEDGTEVNCSQRGLVELPEGNSDKVTQLNLSTNEITVFPSNLDRFPNLVKLDLSGNYLNFIPEKALLNLVNLKLLDLSRNSFKSWLSLNANKFMEPAENIKVLDLSHNPLGTLGNLEMQELLMSTSLEVLVLENCNIQSIHGRSPLFGLTNIKVLKLRHNPLKRIQNLSSLTLKSFDVSHCELSYVHYTSLSHLPALIDLNMAHNMRLALTTPENTLQSNSLRYINVSYCNIMEPSISGFPNLRKAVLSHNWIRVLSSKVFENNTKLEYLDISYNSIGSLDVAVFSGLSTLNYLDLSWNEISVIPENTFQNLPMLSQLNLSRNYISQIGHLKSLSVRILDMSQCEINAISKDSLEGLLSLIDLNLSRNLIKQIPDSISSNTLKYLNFDYNMISSINNYTFFMLPNLVSLSVIGNRFTNIWRKSYFSENPYLDKIHLDDNMWRCECSDDNMYDFYEYLTLEPNKKEMSYNLVCHSPNNLFGQSWLIACYKTWYPDHMTANPNSVVWFLMFMIVGLLVCFVIVSMIRNAMQKRVAAIQEERCRQVEAARERLRQMRIQAEQQAQCNAPDPRDLISPPSYDEALLMPKLTMSCHSLNETGVPKGRRRRGRRKTKSSGDLLEETERNGDAPTDLELSETPDSGRRRRRRSRRCGSHEIAELENSPGFRRRRLSYYDADVETVTVDIDIEPEVTRPLRELRRNSIDDDGPRESDF